MRMLIFSLCLLAGCSCEKLIKKHAVNGHKVTLLSCDNGSVIREWKCQSMVHVQYGIASWVNDDGYRTEISGCYIIEEI
jgi:hypothetical protein